jgi:hypothetical protein
MRAQDMLFEVEIDRHTEPSRTYDTDDSDEEHNQEFLTRMNSQEQFTRDKRNDESLALNRIITGETSKERSSYKSAPKERSPGETYQDSDTNNDSSNGSDDEDESQSQTISILGSHLKLQTNSIRINEGNQESLGNRVESQTCPFGDEETCAQTSILSSDRGKEKTGGRKRPSNGLLQEKRSREEKRLKSYNNSPPVDNYDENKSPNKMKKHNNR